MGKKWIVYRHISSSGKVYIGITSKSKAYLRWGRNGTNYTASTIFNRAILKYGWNNITHEILFSGIDEKRAKSLEMSLIGHYKRLGISYNITDGGQGTLGLHKTEKEKENLRKLHLGKPLSEETKKRMSVTRKGRPGTMLGKKHSEETKEKMSLTRRGKKINRDTSETMRAVYRSAQSTCKKVARVSLESGMIEEIYDSISLAGKRNNCSRTHIADCCKGKIEKFKGYKWIFVNG